MKKQRTMSEFKRWIYDEGDAEKRLQVATTAIRCDRDPATNRERISRRLGQILEEYPDTELVVFGEMILGWYDPLGMTEYHQSISESVPGVTTGLLTGLSKEHGIYVCYGMSEKAVDCYHNTQVLVNPKGEVQAVHRKWNLKMAERQAGYVPGPNPVTITEIKGIKTGIIICSDAAHPRTIWELARSDLDLILYSLADDKDERWFMAKVNARLYDAWIVSANRFGNENNYWNGHTAISDPLGELRGLMVGREGHLVHTLQIARERSRVQKAIRHVFVKTPLLIHVAKNWRSLISYYR